MKSKLEVISDILTEAELDQYGQCQFCGALDPKCECFAGRVRDKMKDSENAKFYPDDGTCVMMYMEQFDISDELGEQYFNDLCDWTDYWCDMHNKEPSGPTEPTGLN